MKIVSLRLTVILISVAFAIIPVMAQEVPDHVVISEVYVNEVDAGSEWIELYNPTDQEVNISGWWIDTNADNKDATIPTGAKIPEYGFYLIADGGFNATGKDNSSWPDADYEEEMGLHND